MSTKTKKSKSLTIALSVAFLALIAVILLITGGLNIFFNFQNQQKLISQQQQLIAKQAANSVNGFVQEKLSMLVTAASTGNLAVVPQDKQKLVLESLLGIEPAFRKLVLFDADGNGLSRISRLSQTLTPWQLIDQFKTNALAQIKNSEEYISPIYIDEMTSEPMVVMAVPVFDVFHDFKGILMSEVNLKFMWDIVDKIKVGNKGLAYVVDRRGNLIAFGDISRVLKGENLIRLKEVSEFVNHKEILLDFVVARGIQNTYVVTTHALLGMPDWAVVVELPVVEAYETVIMGFIVSVLILLLSFVLAVIVGIYLAKRITKPIIELKDAAREISKGNLHTKIIVRSKDEIGELAVSFNQMAEDLSNTTVSRDSLMKEIIERKHAEEELKKAYDHLKTAQDKLLQSEKMAAVGQLAGGVAHEINNPLGVILGFAQVVAKNIKEDDNLYMPLKSIEREAIRCKNLVGDLLTFSRTGKATMEPIDLNATIGSALSLVETRTKTQNVEVIRIFGEGLPKITANSNQIQQIIINLCNNSIDAMPKGAPNGRITITTKKLEKEVEITVSDTGVGILEEVKKHMFEPFFTTKEVGRGTGLGLSLVYEIIKKHNGTIEVENCPIGTGTTFKIKLPVE